MATEFNSKRAHDEWAQPEFDKLSPEIKAIWEMVVEVSSKISQQEIRVNGFVGCEHIRKAMLDVPRSDLGRAAKVIYYWGHWAYTKGVTLRYGNMPPHTYWAKDYPGQSVTSLARKQIKFLDAYGGRGEDTVVKIDPVPAGPLNSQQSGAYWKFEMLVHFLGCEQNWSRSDLPGSFDKICEAKDFMDHQPGTDYSDDELPAMLNMELPGWLQVGKCCRVNHKPHIPVVGNKAMAHAHEKGLGVIGPDAPCDYARRGEYGSGCALTLGEHTSDRVAILRILRDTTNSEISEALRGKFKQLMELHKIDGVTFFETKFKIVNDSKEEADGANDRD